MKLRSTSELEGYEPFQILLENIPMVFYVLDKNGIFKMSDGKGLEKLGLKPGQVIGTSALELYKDFPDIIEALKKGLSGEAVIYTHKLGMLHLQNYISPIFNYVGKIDGIVGATIDITEQVLAENKLESTSKLKDALIESIPGLLYLYNAKGQLEYWNKNHETMTGYSSTELYHMGLMDWYKGDETSQANVAKGLADTTKKGFGAAMTELQKKDGSTLPVYVTAAPLKINNKDYFVGVGIDITAQKETEKKLLELNQTLENKVAERTDELLALNEELTASNEELVAVNEEMVALNQELLESNNKLKEMQSYLVESEKMAALGSLVAGVAHEVNTPLGVGITAASHLSDISTELLDQMKIQPLTAETLTPFLEDLNTASAIILKNLTRAGHLVQSFKQLSVDQSNEETRTFDLGNYLDEILLSLSPAFKQRKIEIHTHYKEPLKLKGWPGAFAQIITNLTMNVLHHAYDENEAGHIHIYMTPKDDFVEIIFQDDGKGMDEKTKSKIFNPFFTTQRKRGGTGLGLSVVYTLVTQKFGGRIFCDATPNQGTTFHILLKQGGKQQ